MDIKDQKANQASTEESRKRCEHPDLKLERGSSYNYLTGWHLCLKCGERLLTR